MNLSKFEMDGTEIDVIDKQARTDASTAIKNSENALKEADGVQSSLSNIEETATTALNEANSSQIIAQRANKNAEVANTNADKAKDLAQNNVSDVSLTNENGIYTLKQTKNGQETEIGTIETSKSNNPLIEIKDSVVTNDLKGYDFHTFTETTEDGTENEVGRFYMSQKQITGANVSGSSLILNTVNQLGTEGTETLELPTGGSGGSDYVIEQFTVGPFNLGNTFSYGDVSLNFNINGIDNANGIICFATSDITTFTINSLKINETSGYNIKGNIKGTINDEIDSITFVLSILHDKNANITIDNFVIDSISVNDKYSINLLTSFKENHEAGSFALITDLNGPLNASYTDGVNYTIIRATSDNVVLIGYDMLTTADTYIHARDAVIYFKSAVTAGDSCQINIKVKEI